MDGQANEAASSYDELASLIDNSQDEIEDKDEQEPDQPGEVSEESNEEAEQNDEPAKEQAANVETQRIKLKLKNEQGEEVEEELSLDEISSGILRDRDYRHKTMELAEQRRQAGEIVHQRVEQAQQEIAASLAKHRQVVDTLVGAFSDERLEALKAQDITAWAEAVERKQAVDRALGFLDQEGQALKQKQQELTQMQRREMARSTWQVLNSSGVTEKDVSAAFAEHKKYYGGLGMVDYDNILDPVSVMTIKDAVAYRKLKEASPKTVKQVQAAPPMPKAKAPTHKSVAQTRAVDGRFKSGNATTRDLAAFLRDNS